MAKRFRVKPGRWVAFAGHLLEAGHMVEDDRLMRHPDFEEVVEVEGVGTATVIDIASTVPILSTSVPEIAEPPAPVIIPSAEALAHAEQANAPQQIVQEISGKIEKPRGRRPKQP
jgi:hypothetical protein